MIMYNPHGASILSLLTEYSDGQKGEWTPTGPLKLSGLLWVLYLKYKVSNPSMNFSQRGPSEWNDHGGDQRIKHA